MQDHTPHKHHKPDHDDTETPVVQPLAEPVPDDSGNHVPTPPPPPKG